jgi:hypothetical protein
VEAIAWHSISRLAKSVGLAYDVNYKHERLSPWASMRVGQSAHVYLVLPRQREDSHDCESDSLLIVYTILVVPRLRVEEAGLRAVALAVGALRAGTRTEVRACLTCRVTLILSYTCAD